MLQTEWRYLKNKIKWKCKQPNSDVKQYGKDRKQLTRQNALIEKKNRKVNTVTGQGFPPHSLHLLDTGVFRCQLEVLKFWGRDRSLDRIQDEKVASIASQKLLKRN